MKRLIFVFLIMTLFSCETSYREVEPPEKPSPVPQNALWTGGVDGGVFVEISKTTISKIYSGTIYADVTGVVRFKGKFEYMGESDFDVNDRLSYGAWDGDYLFLRNNEKLKAIHPK